VRARRQFFISATPQSARGRPGKLCGIGTKFDLFVPIFATGGGFACPFCFFTSPEAWQCHAGSEVVTLVSKSGHQPKLPPFSSFLHMLWDNFWLLPITVCVLPQLAISKHFTVNLHKSLIVAPSFNFARHRQLRQHAVTSWRSCPPSL